MYIHIFSTIKPHLMPLVWFLNKLCNSIKNTTIYTKSYSTIIYDQLLLCFYSWLFSFYYFLNEKKNG